MARKPAAKKVAATLNNEKKPIPPQLKPFQPGNKFGKGRPKGSRNKLGEEFLAKLHADFEQHGESVIKEVRETKPADYLKVVASILPKELNVTTNAVEEMSDDELAAGIAALQSIIAAQTDGEGSASKTKH
jgi:hypothetical protein